MSWVKRQQRSLTGLLIPLDGSVSFCEKFVDRGRELWRLPLVVYTTDKVWTYDVYEMKWRILNQALCN